MQQGILTQAPFSSERARFAVVSEFEISSVQPLCSLCLRGEKRSTITHHRYTKDTEVTQRSEIKTPPASRVRVHFQSPGWLRSEGPAVNSPVRQGGDSILSIAQRPEGPAQIVAHIRRSGTDRRIYPALTDGAINCRSFEPESSN